MIPKPHLKQLLAELLRVGLPSYIWQLNYNPTEFPFQDIDIYGEAEEEGEVIRRLYVQIEPQLTEPLIETHSLVKHELAKRGMLHLKDEYWIATGTNIPTQLKESMASKYIILRDLKWIGNQTRRYRNDSQKLRQIEKILRSQGFKLS